MSVFMAWYSLAFIVFLAISAIPGWLIARKAGFPGALSLLMFVPLVNVIVIWVFAFIRWPNQREGTWPSRRSQPLENHHHEHFPNRT